MRLFLVALTCLLISCSSSKNTTVTPEPLKLYEVIPDDKEKKTLRGLLTKEQITKDTAFGWYADNLKYFRPDSTIVKDIRSKADKIEIVLFCGTWCHDSQQLIPKYISTLEAANFPDQKLTIIGVDRAKTTISGLHKVFGLVSVPTIIVMQNGKEVDRVVEFGKTALVDKELGAIIAGIK
jgi:thiol-disulfide isomerase/thioredoxin